MSTEPQSLVQSLARGLHCRCPACGAGKSFRAFLKVADACPACGEELHHHNADDLPAYVVVSLVGHFMLSAALWMEVSYSPDYWVFAVTLLPIATVMTLGLIQPVKGAIVALQWHMGLDGFAGAKSRRLVKNPA